MKRDDSHGPVVMEVNPPTRPAPAPRPDAPRRKSGLGWLWLLLVLLLLGGGGYYFYKHHESAAPAAGGKPGGGAGGREIPVVAVKARQGDLNLYLTGLGTVTPLNSVTLHTRVDGQIDKVAFTEGQLVHEGDLLAEIDPRPFQVQLTQAEGNLARDQAQLENARKDLDRYEKAGPSISVQERDTQRALVNQYVGTVKVDQGQIDSANLQLKYCRITAPLTGVIGLRLVDQGNIVHVTDPTGLAVINQVQPISVVFTLAEDSLIRIQKARKTTPALPVEVYDRDNKIKLAAGTLAAIDNQIDPTSATAKFKAIVPNEDRVLNSGQFVNARLLVETVKDTVIIPAAAVQRSPQGTFVYVVKTAGNPASGPAPKERGGEGAKGPRPEKTVEMRDIELGPVEGDDAAILSGLEAGETVVTDGVDKLQEGTKVSTTRPAGVPTTKRGRKSATTKTAPTP